MLESTSTPSEMPADELRGIDPKLFKRSRPFTARFVQAPCEKVAAVLSQHYCVERDFVDALASPLSVAQGNTERAFFVFQFAGNSWTQIIGRESYRHDWFEQWLSRELKRGTLIFTLRNGCQYSLYESTNCFTESPYEIEFFTEAGPDYYEYSGGFGFKAASNIYQMTKLDYACLFTKRNTRLDTESPSQIRAFLNRATSELGIYAASDVFHLDEAGQVRLMEPWKREDIRAARLLHFATDIERNRRLFGDEPIDEEAKLEITEGSADFKLMQQFLALFRR